MGNFSRYTRQGIKFKIGCVFIIDKKTILQFGGLLPMVVPRGKGTDTIFSYCASMSNCKFCILNSYVLDIEHHKTKSFFAHWEDSVMANKNFKFSYIRLYQQAKDIASHFDITLHEFNQITKPYYFHPFEDIYKSKCNQECVKQMDQYMVIRRNLCQNILI